MVISPKASKARTALSGSRRLAAASDAGQEPRCIGVDLINGHDEGLLVPYSHIRNGTWAHAVDQFEGMFLTSLAVARLFEVQACENHLLRVRNRRPNYERAASASPALLKAPVGQ